MTTNQSKFTAVKDGLVINGTESNTEKVSWKLIGARTIKDREILKNLGFNVIEQIMPVEGVDLSQIPVEEVV